MNKVLGLAAIFAIAAIAVLAGCSSHSGRSSPTTGTLISPTTSPQKLTGTMDDWIRAVCVMVADGGTAGFMPEAEKRKELREHIRTREREALSHLYRHLQLDVRADPRPHKSNVGPATPYLGPHAEGIDPASNEVVVFGLRDDETPVGERPRPLQPLMTYGFTIQEAVHPTVEPLPTQPPPGNTNATNAMPPPTAMPPSPANGHQIPPDADTQGFVGYLGARCNYTNPAVAIGRTSDSVVVICQTGVGRLYYKGVGLQNGQSVEIDDPVQTGAAFVATNNGVQYSLSPTALIISQGSTVLSNEPMLEYWSA
jgi:hypothetical protein